METASVLPDTTESMESVLNALTVNTTMKLSGSADQDVELMRIIYNWLTPAIVLKAITELA